MGQNESIRLTTVEEINATCPRPEHAAMTLSTQVHDLALTNFHNPGDDAKALKAFDGVPKRQLTADEGFVVKDLEKALIAGKLDDLAQAVKLANNLPDKGERALEAFRSDLWLAGFDNSISGNNNSGYSLNIFRPLEENGKRPHSAESPFRTDIQQCFSLDPQGVASVSAYRPDPFVAGFKNNVSHNNDSFRPLEHSPESLVTNTDESLSGLPDPRGVSRSLKVEQNGQSPAGLPDIGSLVSGQGFSEEQMRFESLDKWQRTLDPSGVLQDISRQVKRELVGSKPRTTQQLEEAFFS